MKIGDKVIVTRQGLMSTGWTGEIVGGVGNKVDVHFQHRNKTLTYNRNSIELVKQEVKKPVKKQEDKFEVKEVNTLVLGDNREIYLIAYKKDDGKINTAKLAFSSNDVDTDNQTLSLPNTKVKFKDIVYLVKEKTVLTFKRPEINEHPFYIFNEDKVAVPVNRFEDENMLRAGEYTMLTKWLEDINSIKPVFEKKQIRVLKQGVELQHGEIFEQVADKLREINNKHSNTKNSFGVVFRNKRTGNLTVWDKLNRPCHYYLSSTGHNVDISHAEFAVQFMCKDLRNTDDNNLRREWLDYVMNDSPWSQYILTKSYDEALDTGILVRTDIPSNAMMCTFYALRYPTEYYAKIKAWKKYSDAGMDKAIAFFAAETYLFDQDTAGHHQLLNTHYMSIDALIKFANKEVGGKVTDNYNQTLSYSNVSVHHGDGKKPNKTAVTALREMDIFGDDKNAGGAFGGGGRMKVSLEKVIKVTNELLGKG